MQQDHLEIKEVQFPNATFLPEIVKLMEEGHTVTLRLKGFSMRPFLEDNRDKALLTKPLNVKTGDPVLAEIAPGHFVLHRIVAIDGQKVTLRGDGNLGTESCRIEDIRALATAFFRKGRNEPDSVKGWKWRIYSWWWMRLLPIRRYLLFAFHPHIPRRFLKHNNQ